MRGSRLQFTLKTVSIEQVKKAINSLKNKTSSGIDFVSPRVVKMAADVICVPLAYIINSSISSGVFPNSWKIAKVIPIYKCKGSRMDKKMYRPVSNLRSVSKVIELIANRQFLDYFESNNLFPSSQHGFRSKRSTFSAIASMHELWVKNQDKREHQAATFLDLSAAFDTLSKDIFCKKMKIYGFDKKSVNWFDSYLTDRAQSVMIGSEMSDPINLSVGCPQGAILSPSIFLGLLADVELWTDAEVCGYADDTSCTNSHKEMSTLVKKCERSVQGLLEYMSVNRLAANDDKTHILVIKGGRAGLEKLKFKIGSEEIIETEVEKLLGMYVSNDLKWTQHISKLERALAARLFKLKCIEQVVPRSLLKRVADGIFMSKLRYGLAIYWPIKFHEQDPNPSAVESLKVVFNDMLRLLCGTRRQDRVSIATMLEKLNWLSLNQLAAEVRLVEVWKALNNKNSLSGLFERVGGSTRASGNNSVKVATNSKIKECSFLYPSARLWNMAPKSVVNAATESQARKAIRTFVKTLPK